MAAKQKTSCYEELVQIVRENPFALINVQEAMTLFRIGKRVIIHLRKLAAKEPATDPWMGDVTNASQFERWLWEHRRRLEKEFPNVNHRP